MPKQDKGTPNDNFTINNYRDSPFFFPFTFGVTFIIVLLILALVVKDPTNYQYTVFRIVLALAGGAFAATLTGSLDIFFPLFKRGWIKASAGFGVFVILFFFSPASLVADEAKFRTENYINQYNDTNGDIFKSQEALIEIWENDPKAKELINAVTENTNEITLGNLKKYNDDMYLKNKSHFKTLDIFFKEIITCVEQKNCDSSRACEAFFEEIEDFRQNYCDQLMEIAERFGDRTWERYEKFVTNNCRTQFIDYYIGDKIEQRKIEKICIPTQCWARHIDPPYPCQAYRQMINGTVLPR